LSFFEELKRRNVVRVGIAYVLLGWVVLQAADFGLDLIDAPNWIIQAMFIIGLAGMPIALFFAWAFELTPEGIKREEDVDRSQSITPKTGRKLDRAIIFFLAAAVVLLLADRYFQVDEQAPPLERPPVAIDPDSGTSAPTRTSIAVLPFVNMSSDQEQEFFSDGISEEILNALARVSELKVAGRTSSFAFKGRNEDLRVIGETLGVDHILEGSVRKAGDKLRITAQLIQVKDGFHLWSETYDRELTDVFAIQDDIASRILKALTTTLEVSPHSSATPLNIADYNKFLMARQLMRERREAPLQQAAALLEQVTANEPDFAPGWAERAVAVLLLRDDLSAYGSIPIEEAMPLARDYLERASAVDPQSPEMLAAYGLYYDNASQREVAIDYLQRALAINPNHSDARNWLWRLLWQQGRHQEALALNEETRALDPLYLPTASNITFDYLVLGQEAALAAHLEQIRRQFGAFDEAKVREVQAAVAIVQADYAGVINTHRPTDRSEDLWSFMRALNLLNLGEGEWAARMAAGTPVEILGLALAGRPEEAKMVAGPLLAQGNGISEYIHLLAANRQYEELVRFFDERWPDREAYEAQVQVKGLGTGLSLGQMTEAFRATGDEARAEEYLARFGEVLDESTREGVNNHWHNFSKAYYATLLGSTEQALEHLADYAASGHVLPPDFTRQWPSFEFLRGDAGFEALLAQMTEQLNRQRAALDLPPYQERLGG
jgi:TolB-like protein